MYVEAGKTLALSEAVSPASDLLIRGDGGSSGMHVALLREVGRSLRRFTPPVGYGRRPMKAASWSIAGRSSPASTGGAKG